MNKLYTGLIEGDYDPETDTLMLKFQEQTPEKRWRDRIHNTFIDMIQRRSKPLYTVTDAIFYVDNGSETKYWDVGMPVKGTGAQILAHADFRKDTEYEKRVLGKFEDNI
jgi:hypothetical protein